MKSCHRVLLAFILLFTSSLTLAQVPPKREFRGAWLATVTNIDWPSSSGISSQVQRDQLTAMLDKLAAAGINAVVMQIRPACDAFYASPYEPWSSWLTGTQGVAPSNDYYDPLQFACQEAHKRGMEIHAWFNPYRVKLSATSPQLATNNVARVHPDWAIECPDGYMLLNPGLSAVRNHVARVVADVVRRYDIDGVHMDDYFYPYSEHSFGTLDMETFRLNPMGFSYPDSLAPWRRNNVNLLIKQMYDSVQVIKPAVKVGMSPFGIWKNGVPAGTSGTSGYNDLYCDAVAWLSGKYIDYITPQLYWRFGSGQDYAKLEPWWKSVTYGRHLYSGNSAPLGPVEIGAQINFNRVNGAQGATLFSAKTVTTNSGGLMDSLKNGYFATAAVIPVMNWKDTLRPNPPMNLRASLNQSTGLYQLAWDASTPASDGDTARRYLVYRFTKQTYQPADLDVASNLLSLTGGPTVVPTSRIDGENLQHPFFAVSALDWNNNESALTNVVAINSTPTTPQLALPANGEKNFVQGAYLRWNRNPSLINYRVQVATSGDFAQASLISTINTTDTVTLISNLAPQSTYYWRTMGGNQAATGTYSGAWSFRTGWPLPVTMISPSSGLRSVSRTPTFVWQKGTGTSFHIRVTAVVSGQLMFDVIVLDTTLLCPTILNPMTNYSWIVSASNAYGTSDYAAEFRFQTGQDVTVVDRNGAIPVDFALSQNYPNPFNPTTNIQFAVPQTGPVSLRVYDVLGREVALLVDDVLQPGFYTARFDGHNFASGVYFYRLIASGFVEMKKMQLVK